MNLLNIFINNTNQKLAYFPILQKPQVGTYPDQYELMDAIRLLGNIINVSLTIVGAVAVIYIIIGGYKYVMSAGNPDAIQQAKSTLLWAIVGFIIAISALVIITFIWNRFMGQTQLPYP